MKKKHTNKSTHRVMAILTTNNNHLVSLTFTKCLVASAVNRSVKNSFLGHFIKRGF